MVYIFKIFNWKAVKKIKTDMEIELKQAYIIKNNFGQFIGTAFSKISENNQERDELNISDNTDKRIEYDEYYEVVKKASEKDIEKFETVNKQNKEVRNCIREKIKEFDLPMKLAGVNHSLDNSSIVVSFTAENRVDFRELVRTLSYSFQKAVRLEQIGSRDEAKIIGGYGPCGKKLCCSLFNSCSKSINTDMARIQQITHRGNERISGSCGRLMCCLAYEVDLYEELSKKLPKIGDRLKLNNKRGFVKNLKVLEKKFLVKFESDEEKWFGYNDLKKFKEQ